MLPEAFQERMRSQLGTEYEAFLEGLEGERHRALRINPLKGGLSPRESRERFLALSPWKLEAVPWEENGYYYTQEGPGRHPYHEAGVYYIQEPSAMAPVAFLGVRPGEKILDLCAAPGGKSTQIAGRLQGKGLLVSNEIHSARARILSENVERLGIRNCLVVNESPEHLAELFLGYFDRILVDAPCSGEGMFRKNENAGEEWSPENVVLCAKRQDGILDAAVSMLRPGGRLVYSTCTFAPEEDEGSISRLIRRHPEMSISDPAPCLSDGCEPGWEFHGTGEAGPSAWGFTSGRSDWIEDPPPEIRRTLRLWPHRLRGEGHYLAVLQKDGREGGEVRSLYGLQPGIPEKDCREYLEFAAGTLTQRPEGIYLRFGDQLYLAPEGLPRLQGLHVLRPGLHLGTLKKNRFEPSHALALALGPEQVYRSFSVCSGDRLGEQEAGRPMAAAYLSGQTFPAQGENGWYLITVDGYSLGWGKLAGGIMKNHYPKGLRKG